MPYRIIAVAGLAGTLSAAAIAAPPIVVEASPQPTAIVSFADLDLSQAAGRARLDGRVRRAAEELCVDTGVRDLAERIEQKGCVSFAVASARPQIERAIAGPRYAERSAKTITLAVR